MSTATNPTDYDVIIIGGAAAGLTAALYSSRRALKTLVLTKALGGQLAMTPSIENYPGTLQSGGMELMMKFHDHAVSYGTEVQYETVSAVRRNDNETFTVITNTAERTAETVILAFGLTPKNLDVPGEIDYQGKGVTYCATCDAPLYKNKAVAVVGGTYEALDAALLLSKLNCQVTLVHKKADYPSQKALFASVQADPRISLQLESTVLRIDGDQTVTQIIVKDASGAERAIPVTGVFVENGHKIDSQWLGDLVNFAKGNAIDISANNETKTPGLFAAGDVTTLRDKQVVISAGEGAKAALSAYHYIQKKLGKPVLRVDWKHNE